uniref:Alanine racemase C-terminal domain-containing protein n=1 Tax=viral metagenome TaxID=1070528 RepID=A0A6C0IF31_9ZZZZ
MKSLKKRNIKNKTVKCNNIPSSFKNITATIHFDLVKKNLEYLRKKSGLDVMPVLKANAYGHGIIEMSKICRKLGVKYIGVATLGEAIQIRNSGDKGRILGWLYDITSNQVKDAVKKNIDIGVFDETHIPIISKSLPKNSVANIHLFIDTGIDRNGVSPEKVVDAAIEITNDPKFKLVGIMSHLCCADTKNNNATNKQFALFRSLKKELAEKNINPELFHISATNGSINYDNSDFNLVRSGAGFYGLVEDKNFTPVMSLTAKIIQLKIIPKGKGIGYDRKYITHSNKYVGIVPLGYADLLPLASPNKLTVYVNGTKRKVLGLESMDQIVIEAKNNDKLGDDVQVFGDKTHGFKQSLFDIAKEGSTTPFDIITHLGERVNREYK